LSAQHTDTPALAGAVRCILRDVGQSLNRPLEELPGKFDTRKAATILGLTTPRTLDTWASKPDHGGLPFIKVGRSRRYLLSDIVAFIASRRTGTAFSASDIADAVAEQVERLGAPTIEDAA